MPRARYRAALRGPAAPGGLGGTGWMGGFAALLGFWPPNALSPPVQPRGVKLSSARCSVVAAGFGEAGWWWARALK